jgi:hypothetical protein
LLARQFADSVLVPACQHVLKYLVGVAAGKGDREDRLALFDEAIDDAQRSTACHHASHTAGVATNHDHRCAPRGRLLEPFIGGGQLHARRTRCVARKGPEASAPVKAQRELRIASDYVTAA